MELDTFTIKDNKILPSIRVTIVWPLYGPGYVTTSAGNLTEQKFCVSMSEFPTGKDTGNVLNVVSDTNQIGGTR
jgi:hypothetical protein